MGRMEAAHTRLSLGDSERAFLFDNRKDSRGLFSCRGRPSGFTSRKGALLTVEGRSLSRQDKRGMGPLPCGPARTPAAWNWHSPELTESLLACLT